MRRRAVAQGAKAAWPCGMAGRSSGAGGAAWHGGSSVDLRQIYRFLLIKSRFMEVLKDYFCLYFS